MRFSRLFAFGIMSMVYLIMIYLDSGNQFVSDFSNASFTAGFAEFDSQRFVTYGIVPLLYAWSFYFFIMALASAKAKKG